MYQSLGHKQMHQSLTGQHSKAVLRQPVQHKILQKPQRSFIIRATNDPKENIEEKSLDVQKVAQDIIERASKQLDGVVEVFPESVPKNYAKGGIVAFAALIGLWVFQRILGLVVLLGIVGIGLYVYTQYNKAAGEDVDESVDEAKKMMDKWKS